MKKQIDDDEFFDDDGYCDECGGSGWLMECCDDICHGLGYCIHGDGDVICHCNADLSKSFAPDNAPAEWKPTTLNVRAKRK
jgi:hypothetical protein